MDTSNNSSSKSKNRLIRLPEVLRRTGYGRTSIYRKMEEGSFPRSVKLGGPLEDSNAFDCRAIAWLEDEVEQWMATRIKERDLGSKDMPASQNDER